MASVTFTGYIAGTTLYANAPSSGSIQWPMAITWSGSPTTPITYIVAAISGSGQAGSYQVNISQSVGTSLSPVTFHGTTPLILANDYNTIQGTIAGILGNASTGYGQPLNSTAVSTGNNIKVTDWNALQQDITNVYYHQIQTPALSLTTATNAIKIKETDRLAYQTIATNLANIGTATVNGVSYPGAYAIPPSTQLTNSASSPTAGGFPYIANRIGTSRPWGGTSTSNPTTPITATGYITGTTLTTTTLPSGSIAAGMRISGGSIAAGTTISTVNYSVFSGYINSTGLINTIGPISQAIVSPAMLDGAGQSYLPVKPIILYGSGTQYQTNNTLTNVGTSGNPVQFNATSYTISSSQSVGNISSPVTFSASFGTPESNVSVISNIITVSWTGGNGYSAAQAAQYFFNSGGSIQFNASMSSPGTLTPTIPTSAGAIPTTGTKNYSWYTLLNNMGTINFSYYGVTQSGSGGTGTSYGWQYFLSQAGNQFTPIFVQSAGTPGTNLYAPNQYTIWAQLNAQANQLTFQIDFEDLSSSFPTVTGTVSSTGAPSSVFLNISQGNISSILQGTIIILTGTGGNGLTGGTGSSATTYYVASVNAGNNSVTLATSYNNATAATPIVISNLITATLSGTSFQAAGTEDYYKQVAFGSGGTNPYDIDEDVTGTLSSEVNISYASGNYVTMVNATGQNVYNYLPNITTVNPL